MTNFFRSRERGRGAFATPAVRLVCIVVAALHATMPIAAQSPPSSQSDAAGLGVHAEHRRRGSVRQQRAPLYRRQRRALRLPDHREPSCRARIPRALLHLPARLPSAYQLYQQLSELNAFDQRPNTSYRQLLTPRVSLVARNSLSKSPTTDALDLPGVVFRRQGVTMDDFRGGIEARLTEHTTLGSDYTFQWLKFDDDDAQSPIDALERGGLAHGVASEVDHVLSPRLTVGASHEMRHATVDNEPDFDVQSAMGTADWRIDRGCRSPAAPATPGWRPTARRRRTVRRPSRSISSAPVRVWAGTSDIAGRSCRRSASAARSRTRNSRRAPSGRSPAGSIWSASTSVLDADPLSGGRSGTAVHLCALVAAYLGDEVDAHRGLLRRGLSGHAAAPAEKSTGRALAFKSSPLHARGSADGRAKLACSIPGRRQTPALVLIDSDRARDPGGRRPRADPSARVSIVDDSGGDVAEHVRPSS